MDSLVKESQRDYLLDKLQTLFDETQDQAIGELLKKLESIDLLHTHDLLNTRLMDNFKNFGNPIAFSLLYELNYQGFLSTIYHRIRKYYFLLDPSDILQEVFFNIYRYPYKFKSDKAEAFRHWTQTIIRNTIIKHLKSRSRVDKIELVGEGLSEKVDKRVNTPLRSAMNSESEEECSRAFLLYLYLYWSVYNRLSGRERRALFLVEVAGASYKDASVEMDIKLENLKMVIFRARKKIFRSLRKIFSATPSVGDE